MKDNGVKSVYIVTAMLVIEPRIPQVLGKWCLTEIHHQSRKEILVLTGSFFGKFMANFNHMIQMDQLL